MEEKLILVRKAKQYDPQKQKPQSQHGPPHI